MADSQLIQGAAAVAQTKGGGKLAVTTELTKAAAYVAEGTAKAIKRNNIEFNQNLMRIMNSELERDPGMSEAEYTAMYKKLKKKRFGYVYLNKKDKMLAKRDLLEMKKGLEKNENLKKDIAGDITGGDLGDDPKNKLGDNADDIVDIVNGDKELIQKDGKTGYMITNPDANKYAGMTFDEAFKANRDMNIKLHGMDFSKWTNFMWSGKKTGNKLEEFHPYQQDDIDKRGAKVGNSVPFESEIFKTTDEIQSLVDSKKVDSKSKETIQGLLDNVVEKATNIKPEDNAQFNYNQMFQNVRNNIIETGDLKSLMEDPMFAGRNFTDDLTEALQNGTYQNLGIDKKIIERLDPTDNGKITKRDIKRIMKAIKGDDDLAKNLLAEYITKGLEQNHNNSLPDSSKKDNKKEGGGGSTDDTSDTSNTGDTSDTGDTGGDNTEVTSSTQYKDNYLADLKSSPDMKFFDGLFGSPEEELIFGTEKYGFKGTEQQILDNIYSVRSGEESIPTIVSSYAQSGATHMYFDDGAEDLAAGNAEKLGRYGFNVVAKGEGKLIITAPNGKKKEFGYDYYTSGAESDSRAEMNAFIQANFPGKNIDTNFTTGDSL